VRGDLNNFRGLCIFSLAILVFHSNFDEQYSICVFHNIDASYIEPIMNIVMAYLQCGCSLNEANVFYKL
jgi:hypothetical protein